MLTRGKSITCHSCGIRIQTMYHARLKILRRQGILNFHISQHLPQASFI